MILLWCSIRSEKYSWSSQQRASRPFGKLINFSSWGRQKCKVQHISIVIVSQIKKTFRYLASFGTWQCCRPGSGSTSIASRSWSRNYDLRVQLRMRLRIFIILSKAWRYFFKKLWLLENAWISIFVFLLKSRNKYFFNWYDFCVCVGTGSGAVIRIYGSAEPKEILTAPHHCFTMIFSTRALPSVGFSTGRAKRNRLKPVVPSKILPSLPLQ